MQFGAFLVGWRYSTSESIFSIQVFYRTTPHPILLCLQDPETQQELFDFAKRGCEAFESYKQLCDEYVDQYGPIMIGIAVSYLQPEQFCTRLGYCSPEQTLPAVA
jgi:hypothetical protein